MCGGEGVSGQSVSVDPNIKAIDRSIGRARTPGGQDHGRRIESRPYRLRLSIRARRHASIPPLAPSLRPWIDQSTPTHRSVDQQQYLPAAMRMADERRATGAGARKAEAVQAREAKARSFMGLWAVRGSCIWVSADQVVVPFKKGSRLAGAAAVLVPAAACPTARRHRATADARAAARWIEASESRLGGRAPRSAPGWLQPGAAVPRSQKLQCERRGGKEQPELPRARTPKGPKLQHILRRLRLQVEMVSTPAVARPFERRPRGSSGAWDRSTGASRRKRMTPSVGKQRAGLPGSKQGSLYQPEAGALAVRERPRCGMRDWDPKRVSTAHMGRVGFVAGL